MYHNIPPLSVQLVTIKHRKEVNYLTMNVLVKVSANPKHLGVFSIWPNSSMSLRILYLRTMKYTNKKFQGSIDNYLKSHFTLLHVFNALPNYNL